MTLRGRRVRPSLAGLIGLALLAASAPARAHPLGNVSISQYTGIRVGADAVELRYLVDLAEIPTFQEIQDTGIVPEPGHASLQGYLPRRAEALKEGLRLEALRSPGVGPSLRGVAVSGRSR
jgi:hypothetical protein